MTPKPLKVLLSELEAELIRLRYTKGSMTFYRSRWSQLLQFAEENQKIYYSEELGIDFVEAKFQISRKDFEKKLSQRDTQELRIVRMIGDFQLHGTILRRYYKHHELLTNPYFKQVREEFRNHCEIKDYSNITIDHYVKQAARFMDYLDSQGVKYCSNIKLDNVHAYIRTLAGYTYKTVEQCICGIRCFLRFLRTHEILDDDLASKTPMIQARKQTRIPSVWTADELKRLINAIDRGSPKGKRDYAMILLACTVGLRVSDIKKLTFDSFRWSENKLVFVQSKTRQTVTLPLLGTVGWAVIDYLKHGRPIAETNIVFIRHIAPFLPFSEADHLSQIIKSYMRIAHLPTLKKRRGMHSLRHTAASRMLEHDTPLAVISDILGHSDTDSTAVYLKVDLDKLRACSLELNCCNEEELPNE